MSTLPRYDSSFRDKPAVEHLTVDPLGNNEFALMGGNYETSRFRLPLRLPTAESDQQLIFLRGEEINDEGTVLSLSLYAERKALLAWAGEKSRHRSWISGLAGLLKEILNQNKPVADWHELTEEADFKEHKDFFDLMNHHRKSPAEGSLYSSFAIYYDHSRATKENIAQTTRAALNDITQAVIRKGEIAVQLGPDGPFLNEVEYYGSGRQWGPLAGSGSVHFVYNDHVICEMDHWIS